jgi:putative transposase
MPLAPQEIRTFFVTTVTAQRRRLFQVDRNSLLLIQVLQENRAKSRLKLHAFVIMPDHLHLLLTPACDVSLEKAMQYIKGGFSFRLKSKFDVWEKGFNEHRIAGAPDYSNHLSYLEANPVRRALVETAAAYQFSSASGIHDLDAVPLHLTGSRG